jgi:hypothetical protein
MRQQARVRAVGDQPVDEQPGTRGTGEEHDLT